jgi:hypothetical protein
MTIKVSEGIMVASENIQKRDNNNIKRMPIATHEKWIMNCETRVFSSSAKMGGVNTRSKRLTMMIYYISV